MIRLRKYLITALVGVYLVFAAASPFLWDTKLAVTLMFGVLMFAILYALFLIRKYQKERKLFFNYLAKALHQNTYTSFKEALRDLLRLERLLTSVQKGLDNLIKGERVNHEYFNGSFMGSKILHALSEVDARLSEKGREEQRQIWNMQGLAEFSDILKNDDQTLAEKGDIIVSKLVKHLNINQGGIFLKKGDEHDPYMELVSCYAYDKKKYTEKTIKPREGLIGQCWLEMAPVVITEIPDQYMEITSGLGHKTASFVAVYPLCYNEEVVGAIELAAFHTLEDYELQFIEKLCANIAAFLHSKLMNESLRELLENTERMNMTLQEQEEELRQNAEEMHTTQEMLERKVDFQYQCIEQLQDVSDNLIINAAGRNRMLTQKMGYNAQLVMKGKREAIMPLTQAADLHDQCLQAFKYGGPLKGLGDGKSITPIYQNMRMYLDRIDEVWPPFKDAVNELVKAFDHDEPERKERALEFIEDNLEKLVARNNELVNAYSEENNQKRQNIFNELESSLKVA